MRIKSLRRAFKGEIERVRRLSVNKSEYPQRINELTARAKAGNDYTKDCDIGEAAYLETLIALIREWQSGRMSKDTLIKNQKELESKLMSYYQHREMFDRHIQINNRYSHILTEAEKTGCPICRKIVRIFDGRE